MNDADYLLDCIRRCADEGEFARVAMCANHNTMRHIFSFEKMRDGRRFRCSVDLDLYEISRRYMVIPDIAQYIVNQIRMEFIKSNTQETTTNQTKGIHLHDHLR